MTFLERLYKARCQQLERILHFILANVLCAICLALVFVVYCLIFRILE